MKKNYILDCTLRDGGYCNQWQFGEENIRQIIRKLTKSRIDIIECGFLTEKTDFNENITRFDKIERLKTYIKRKNESLYVLMANYGEYDFNKLPENEGIIDGIRVAFHKEDLEKALAVCQTIKKKGYKVFVQPMVSLRYTDSDFIELLLQMNKIMPYAFYIVDSFGSMKERDLRRLFYLADHNLDENILLGFHSHNNLQLALSNAQTLLNTNTERSLIIDSSVMGMGRGAGNLNTELITQYLNKTGTPKYKIDYLLKIIDEVLTKFYENNAWGYSLPNYLSAVYECHPNYATYLEKRKSLTVEDMKKIFESFNITKRSTYDEGYIKSLYLGYLTKKKALHDDMKELQKRFTGKEVLLIAPGKSSEQEKDKIKKFCCENKVIVISVNGCYPYVETDYIFISNLRRYRSFEKCGNSKLITTSNIDGKNSDFQIEYSEFINSQKGVEDNAALMLLSLLIRLECRKIYLAGIDGYAIDEKTNYRDEKMNIKRDENSIKIINVGLAKKIKDYRELADISYITKHKNVLLEDYVDEERENKNTGII